MSERMGKVMEKLVRCRYCGADILYRDGAEHVRCEYCGRQMELPGMSEEEKQILAAVEEAKAASENAAQAAEKSSQEMRETAEAYARKMARRLEEMLAQGENKQLLQNREKLNLLYEKGAEFQRAGRFEEAVNVFQSVLEIEPGSAEAHWQMLMCRYGIEYVCNEADGEYIPTISHLREDSVLEDPDYHAALKFARNDDMREYYRREAEHIHAILSRYIQIRDQEEYDVFISVKQGDTFGNPTKDSQIAQDIYHMLTHEHGLKVFNSRISLQSHAGEEWEPYIMAALLSSKVMLVVGTKPENMSAPWVRNEWRRFRWLMANRKGKRTLIPCVSGMSASALPTEMGYLQAVTLSDLNGKEALLKAIADALNMEIKPDSVKSAAVSMSGVFRMLEEKKWQDANAALDLLIERDEAEAAREGAYYAKLMCERQANNLSALRRKGVPLENSPFYARALENAGSVLRKQLQECNLEIIQRGVVGDVWGRIREESGNLKNLSAGAALVPIFREAYEQNGAALEIYKDDFNEYIDLCKFAELEPVRNQLKVAREKVVKLEKECIDGDKTLQALKGKTDRIDTKVEKPAKLRTFVGKLLAFLMIGSVLWTCVLIFASVMGLVDESFGMLLALLGTVVFVISLFLLIITRKKRRKLLAQKEAKYRIAMANKETQSKELKTKISETENNLVSMRKSIENYKVNIEKLETEEKRILERYPKF